MRKDILGLAMLPLLALGACSVAPPSGPTVVAMPAPGKSWPQFQEDDYNCRNYAQSRISNSGQVSADTQNNSAKTAVAGTLLGAAVGAGLGSLAGNVGAGAAVGAGAGLLGGASVAGNNAQATADSLQGRYDVAYAQCMVGNGETIQQGPYASAQGYYAAPPPPAYYAPY
ncbi:MAG: glycine zipper family protein [Acidocella sp.]|uniref:hypothetical protein n=1 Tax=Acidocella sp. TaxID=50710 RepID=UPI003FD8A6BC